jgi:hypothetical protein
MPREAARAIMVADRDRAISSVRLAAELAFIKTDAAVREARTQGEIERIQQCYADGVSKLVVGAHALRP